MASLQKVYDSIIKPRRTGNNQTSLLYSDNNHNLNDTHVKHESIRHYIHYCYQRKHDLIIDFTHIDSNIKKICEIYATGLRIASQLANHIYYQYENKKSKKTTTLAITYEQIINNLAQIAEILNAAVDSFEQKSMRNHLCILLDDAKIHLLNQLDNFITLASNSFLGTRKRPCKRFESFSNNACFMAQHA